MTALLNVLFFCRCSVNVWGAISGLGHRLTDENELDAIKTRRRAFSCLGAEIHTCTPWHRPPGQVCARCKCPSSIRTHACSSAGLVAKVDGDVHDLQNEEDERREKVLSAVEGKIKKTAV